MRQVSVARGGIPEGHHKPMGKSLVQPLRTVVASPDIILDTVDRFGQLQNLLEDLVDVFLCCALFKFKQGDMFDFRHIHFRLSAGSLGWRTKPQRASILLPFFSSMTINYSQP